MAMTANERDVKSLYAAIVKQALIDVGDFNPAMYSEIYEFFVSDYGKSILDVLGIKFSAIDAKFKISEKNQMYKSFIREYEIGLNDIELSIHLGWDVKEVIYWRRKLGLPECKRKK